MSEALQALSPPDYLETAKDLGCLSLDKFVVAAESGAGDAIKTSDIKQTDADTMDID